MKIAYRYSHLNGWENMKVHRPGLLQEIEDIINVVNADDCRSKVSKEKRTLGDMLISPVELNKAFAANFEQQNWVESRVTYYVTSDEKVIRETMQMDMVEQKRAIEDAGLEAYKSYNQTDFTKDRVAVEVQFGKYAFVAYDMFVKHLAFYTKDQIDVGVEILPTKLMTKSMSNGIGYYEGELYNLIRHGRGVPSVPLVIYGIEP